MSENGLTLDPQTRERMVETKVTCPFLGSLVHQNLLAVKSAPDNPLAAIDEVQSDLARHSKAARRLAEDNFDSDKVLTQLLHNLGVAS